MSVTFHWILARVDPAVAPALRARFRAAEAAAAARLSEETRRVLGAWRSDPQSLDPHDPRASEAFNRAFHLPLEPFVHDVLFRGLEPAWQPGADDLVLVSADRVPPTASLAVALGPERLATLPGDCLQLFVDAADVDQVARTARALVEPATTPGMLARARSWLALHNSLRFADGSYEGLDAARRLLAALPEAAARAAAEQRALFSACAVAL